MSCLKFFRVFLNLSVPCWDSTSVRLRSFPFKSGTIHYSSIMLSFDAI
jgi:hypothetical protein